MKIEKQADTQTAHTEIGQHLRVVCRHEFGNRFDFDHDLPIDQNVGAEAFVELDALVNDWDSNLPLKADFSSCQLMTQAAFVDGFKHTGTGDPMHLDGKANDLLGQFAREQHAVLPSCGFVVLRGLRVKHLILRNHEPPGPCDQTRGPGRTDAVERSGRRSGWRGSQKAADAAGDGGVRLRGGANVTPRTLGRIGMTRLLEHAIAAANNLPSDAQDDIARVILRLTGADDETTPVQLSPAKRASIGESKAAAARGEFAGDEQVRVMWAKHGL